MIVEIAIVTVTGTQPDDEAASTDVLVGAEISSTVVVAAAGSPVV